MALQLALLFDGFNSEERFGHYVHESTPDAMRVLDMQDFHALRLGREHLVEAGASLLEVVVGVSHAWDPCIPSPDSPVLRGVFASSQRAMNVCSLQIAEAKAVSGACKNSDWAVWAQSGGAGL